MIDADKIKRAVEVATAEHARGADVWWAIRAGLREAFGVVDPEPPREVGVPPLAEQLATPHLCENTGEREFLGSEAYLAVRDGMGLART